MAPDTRSRSGRPPGTLRARLIVNFALIVGLALIIVLAALPRLLDGYFVKQSEDELRTRTSVMKQLVYGRLVHLDLPDSRGGVYSLEAIYRTDTPPGPAASWLIERFKQQASGVNSVRERKHNVARSKPSKRASKRLPNRKRSAGLSRKSARASL